MEAPFFSLVDELLLGAAGGDNNIAVGPLFVRMFEHVQAFHTMGHVFVDVKADNFMLTKKGAPTSASSKKPPPGNNKRSAASSPSSPSLRHAQQLADRIRWMDLALARKYRNHLTGNGAHVENLEGQTLVGTPLYCSLHAHEGATLSRRDDVFAILLVLSELVIRLQAALDQTTESYQPNHQNQFPSFLPWANESSLAILGTRKKELVLDPKSELYGRMPSNVASHMYQWLMQAHNLAYVKEPPYEDWKTDMQSLSIPILSKAAAAAAAGRRKTATKTTATTTRRKGDDASPLGGRTTARNHPTSTAPASLKETGKTSSRQAKRPPVPPDSAVEPVQKLAKLTPTKPASTAATSTRASKKMASAEDCDTADRGANSRRPSASDSTVLGIVLRAIEGPLQGKSYYLAKGHCDQLLLGSAPPSSTGKAVSIPDDSLDKTHAKLSLIVTAGGSRIVKVECVGKDAACTTVNHSIIARNKSGRAFPNDTIGLGSSVFKVSYFDEPLSQYLGKENNEV